VSPAAQTLWAELLAATLADAGVATCVISPGSRSTPLVAALARDGRCALPSIIDERAAAFFALGIARATGKPAAIVCTSGSAAAHYLPAIVEASAAGIPLVAITADRPPELQACGATQTIDQIGIYGGFVRGALDLGAPIASVAALRALRRKVAQAVQLARGPVPGPVHLEVPLRKPLEPSAPATADELAAAVVVAELRGSDLVTAPPRLEADDATLVMLAEAIAREPDGIVIAGALPGSAVAAREPLFALCARAGYPLLAEAGSQLRFAARPAGVTAVDRFDIVLAAPRLAGARAPKLVIQLGAEPVGAGWITARPQLAGAARWVLAGPQYRDPDSSAAAVIVGEVAPALARVVAQLGEPHGERTSFPATWRDAERRAAAALDRTIDEHAGNEAAALRAALAAAPPHAIVQIGNSLPIRVVDQACAGGAPRTVIVQRGAAGIDGLVASAAGATGAGVPVLLVLGDVSFAHDVGGLLAAREATAPLAIVVLDNGGGRIFDGLPVARAGLGAAFERHFITPPDLDPAAIARAFGARGVTAAGPAELGRAVEDALAIAGATVIHAPCSRSGAHDVRRHAIELVAIELGASHD
jgi:2-succinyl-5-enolpyruvyl-6-hydroxy-3-cyclohexene-1-carboxylate synthase